MLFIIIPSVLLIILFTLLFIFINNSGNAPELQSQYNSSHYVLTVKNCEDSIEGMIRSTVWQFQASESTLKTIVVVDLGSEDQTGFIIGQLAKEYSFLHPMSKTEYIRFITDL